jgi:hypothetical protein
VTHQPNAGVGMFGSRSFFIREIGRIRARFISRSARATPTLFLAHPLVVRVGSHAEGRQSRAVCTAPGEGGETPVLTHSLPSRAAKTGTTRRFAGLPTDFTPEAA